MSVDWWNRHHLYRGEEIAVACGRASDEATSKGSQASKKFFVPFVRTGLRDGVPTGVTVRSVQVSRCCHQRQAEGVQIRIAEITNVPSRPSARANHMPSPAAPPTTSLCALLSSGEVVKVMVSRGLSKP